jgi:tRNA pseudouridine65 synthase
LWHFKELSGFGGESRPGIVHRLDKPTSGVLLFALDAKMASQMGELIMAKESAKEYIAIVRGFSPESGIIDHALKEKLDSIADKDTKKDKEAQEAVTEFERVATVELPFCVGKYPSARYSLVRLKPRTGRKHQLRRHMKNISHHMIGDTNY